MRLNSSDIIPHFSQSVPCLIHESDLGVQDRFEYNRPFPSCKTNGRGTKPYLYFFISLIHHQPSVFTNSSSFPSPSFLSLLSVHTDIFLVNSLRLPSFSLWGFCALQFLITFLLTYLFYSSFHLASDTQTSTFQ